MRLDCPPGVWAWGRTRVWVSVCLCIYNCAENHQNPKRTVCSSHIISENERKCFLRMTVLEIISDAHRCLQQTRFLWRFKVQTKAPDNYSLKKPDFDSSHISRCVLALLSISVMLSVFDKKYKQSRQAGRSRHMLIVILGGTIIIFRNHHLMLAAPVKAFCSHKQLSMTIAADAARNSWSF